MSQNQPDTHNQREEATPNATIENEGRQLSTGGDIPTQNDADATASGNPEAGTTQESMGDGSGIRGDYGNASQTNGAEGAPKKQDEQAGKHR